MIGDAGDRLEVVGHHQHDRALGLGLAEPLAERLGAVAIEAGERLVEQQQRRPGQQRAGQGQALDHAARVGPHRPGPGPRLEADLVEQGGGAGRRVGDAVQPGEELEVLDRRQLAVTERGVGEQPDLGPQRVVGGARPGVVEVADRAGRRPHQRRQHADQGRLAGAVGAEQRAHLAGLQSELDADQRPMVAVPLAQAADLDLAQASARRGGRAHLRLRIRIPAPRRRPGRPGRGVRAAPRARRPARPCARWCRRCARARPARRAGGRSGRRAPRRRRSAPRGGARSPGPGPEPPGR